MGTYRFAAKSLSLDEADYVAAEQFYDKGNLKDAAAVCQNILSRNPYFGNAYLLTSELFRSVGNFPSAIQFAQKAVKCDQKRADYHRQLGFCLMLDKQDEKALKSLNNANRILPDDAITLSLLGRFYVSKQKGSEALKWLRRAYNISPDAETLEQMAMAMIYNRDFPDAERTLAGIIEKNPQAARSQALLAALLIQRHRFVEAGLVLQKSLELLPDDQSVLLLAANFNQAQGNMEEAVNFALRSLGADSNNLIIYGLLGYIYQKMSRFPEAEKVYEIALAKWPQDVSLINEYVITLLQLGKRAEAKKIVSDNLRMLHKNKAMEYLYAAVSGETGKFSQSPKDYVVNLFDSYSEKFETHLQGVLQYRTPMLLAETFNTLAAGNAVMPSDLALLDLGCGTGLAAEAFAKYTSYRTGVDLSPKMLEKARDKELYNDLHVDGIEEFLEKCRRKFDIILAADVFVYIGEIGNVFAKVKEKLATDGYFIFSTENAEDSESYQLLPSLRYAHAHGYVESLAQKAGFRIECAQDVVLRKELQQGINGCLYIMRHCS